jgi:hypothetical protein
MKINYIIFSIFAWSNLVLSQFDYKPVLKGQQGQDLWMEVRTLYRPAFTMDYSIARDTLYRNIDAKNFELECIYTGMKLALPDTVDPTEYVYLGGIVNGMNAEHVYPQSYGLDVGIQRSDLHNIFPCRIGTNSDRGNRPFAESPDASTERWYYLTEELPSKPQENIDLYSELGKNGIFEPRESKKGDVARAMFYIYTVYRDEVNAANSNFFEAQIPTLCGWHNDDPVDETEWIRTHKIAAYQDNKENPFVLDCSLLSRTYCSTISEACLALTTSSNDLEYTKSISIQAFPNPNIGGEISLSIDSNREFDGTIIVFNTNGSIVFYQAASIKNTFNNLIHLDKELAPASYIISLFPKSKYEAVASTVLTVE